MQDYNNKYLLELSKKYPNSNAVISEIINLNAILSLPKGTEHFLSDIHGEYEAFLHIRRNASGVIRNKVDKLFSKTVTERERAELATLIYYPEEKLMQLEEKVDNVLDWYEITIIRLLEVCRLVSSKYTRSKVRKHLNKTAKSFEYIIDELLNNDYDAVNKDRYYENIIKTVIEIGAAKKFIVALSAAIKSLVIDHLHIVGDIFDRGPRADIIVDELIKENSLDIQWGNHDVLWLGAAAGSRVCIATVLNNSITYKNLDVLEIGYGISLRPLTLFAEEYYKNSNVSVFLPKGNSEGDFLNTDDDNMIARMHKAISIIQFKLEGQAILRNPDFQMEHRLLLDKIDWEAGTVKIDGISYELNDADMPTVNREDPFALSKMETELMDYLKNAFVRSEKLQRHARFLFEKGEMYTVFNSNLLFHGCIPFNSDGSFLRMKCAENKSGKALLDYFDKTARQGYFAKEGTKEKLKGKDYLWFLWCGKNSPLCARERITTFERLFVKDESTWQEPKNCYYSLIEETDIIKKIFEEFSLCYDNAHIINGHIPVRSSLGEEPVKAQGKVIVIDGGFCKAYQQTTGIAGYTLIYNAEGIRISAHEPFKGIENAIKRNIDIISDTIIFEYAFDKIRVKDTDIGKNITEQIEDLKCLLAAYESGKVKETGI